jgi:YHS domain-containing protein
MPIDPVCHKAVDVRYAAAFCEYKGRVYYFCSSGCHKTFTADLHKISGWAARNEEWPADRRQDAELRRTAMQHP